MDDNNKSNQIWQEVPYQPMLGRDRVHVWRASLDLPTAKIKQLATLLSGERKKVGGAIR